jgi:hypothetical protein
MKKTVLSTFAALALGTITLSASSIKLYQDEKGQVFTTPAEGRTLIKDDSTSIFSKADKLKLSGLTYVGYRFSDFDDDTADVDYKDDSSQFELRRAYFQLKAYLMDDPKSYYRITFDVHQDNKIDGDTTDGDNLLRIKYAYVYLNNILPYTGIEIGIAHRPWHDYEEHNAWYYRNISKVLIEQGNGAHLSNSADFGFNFKTKTKYFDSELGLFNGEGYHSIQNQKGMSFEWRTTAHILGVNGKDKQITKTYWDASFFGQYNMDHKTFTVGDTNEAQDLIFGGLHTVYNQPSFLVAAQYVYSDNTSDIANNVSVQAGSGYSLNGEYRFGEDKEFRVLGRYDSWTPEAVSTSAEYERRTYIAGGAWEQNKNIQWVANVDITDNDDGSSRQKYNSISYMITTEIRF